MSTPKATALRFQHGPYTLYKSPATLFPFEVHLDASRALYFFSWTLWLLHIITDIAFAYRVQQDAAQTPWPLWIALLSNLLLAIPEIVTACTIIPGLCTNQAARPRPDYRLQGSVAPSVDIMITSCGEPADIVINTVTAAAVQDYPPDRFRVFILDDGHDAELRHAVDLLRLRLHKTAGPSVIYLSRTVASGQESWFKSGNLRFGIEESQRLEKGSEYLAGLDADMIPQPDWLRRMVPHLLLNDRVAVAAGPQRYYNVPASDPLGQQADFDIYFTVQELLNDCLGATMCTGTGYVARRSAIAEIGGWPLAYSGEDYMCSALLTAAGWEVVFVRSPLQTGLAPESLTAAMKQRMRWTDAGLEVHQRLAPYSRSSALTSRMKSSVRAVNFIYIIRDYSPLTTCLGMLLLPLSLMPIFGPDDAFHPEPRKHGNLLFWTQTLFLITHIIRNLREYVTYRHLDLSLVANIYAQELWSAPYSAYRCTISLLSLLPLPPASKPTFTVCGAITDETAERTRAPLRSRLSRPDIVLSALYVLYALAPLVWRLLWCNGPGLWGGLAGFAFPALLLREGRLVSGVARLVLYMLRPPVGRRWEELVVEAVDGVKRPKGEGEGRGRTGWGWFAGVVCEGLVVWGCFGL